jgi:hypothetical protein
MENEKNKNIQFTVHNFNTTEGLPIYTERVTRSGYVSYGEDNLYPDYLISLMNRSAKHNAILKRKAMMIAGNGFDTTNIDGLAASFIANPYNDMNLNEIAFRSAYDLELFGAFALEIIYSKDKSKIAEVNYLPANKVRLSEDGKSIYYSNDWCNLRKFGPEKYSAYNPKNPTSNQILYVKEYRPGTEYYGIPEYISCVNWIELEYEISTFHLNQVKNGFMPSMIINFNNGVPSDDEMKDVVRQLKNDFKGAKGETVMFLFADGKDRAAEITPVQLNDSDERFIQLNSEITQGILTGHSVTNPGLFGISTPGELGQKNVILESLEIFQSMYVAPKQDVITSVYNNLLKFNGSTTKLVLNKYELDIQKINGEA